MTKKEIKELYMFSSEVYVGVGLYPLIFAGWNKDDEELVDLIVPAGILDKMEKWGVKMDTVWTVHHSKLRLNRYE